MESNGQALWGMAIYIGAIDPSVTHTHTHTHTPSNSPLRTCQNVLATFQTTLIHTTIERCVCVYTHTHTHTHTHTYISGPESPTSPLEIKQVVQSLFQTPGVTQNFRLLCLSLPLSLFHSSSITLSVSLSVAQPSLLFPLVD